MAGPVLPDGCGVAASFLTRCRGSRNFRQCRCGDFGFVSRHMPAEHRIPMFPLLPTLRRRATRAVAAAVPVCLSSTSLRRRFSLQLRTFSSIVHAVAAGTSSASGRALPGIRLWAFAFGCYTATPASPLFSPFVVASVMARPRASRSSSHSDDR